MQEDNNKVDSVMQWHSSLLRCQHTHYTPKPSRQSVTNSHVNPHFHAITTSQEEIYIALPFSSPLSFFHAFFFPPPKYFPPPFTNEAIFFRWNYSKLAHTFEEFVKFIRRLMITQSVWGALV